MNILNTFIFVLFVLILINGTIELFNLIVINIKNAITDFIRHRECVQLARELAEYPIEFIGEDGKVKWIYNKKGNRDV
jgi:hypothetical protein